MGSYIFRRSLFVLVPVAQNVEGFLLFALVAHHSLPVVVVLNAGQHASGRAEILQNPGGGAMLDYHLLDKLTLGVNLSGQGKTWWDEANTYSQKFYALLGAHAD